MKFSYRHARQISGKETKVARHYTSKAVPGAGGQASPAITVSDEVDLDNYLDISVNFHFIIL